MLRFYAGAHQAGCAGCCCQKEWVLPAASCGTATLRLLHGGEGRGGCAQLLPSPLARAQGRSPGGLGSKQGRRVAWRREGGPPPWLAALRLSCNQTGAINCLPGRAGAEEHESGAGDVASKVAGVSGPRTVVQQAEIAGSAADGAQEARIGPPSGRAGHGRRLPGTPRAPKTLHCVCCALFRTLKGLPRAENPQTCITLDFMSSWADERNGGGYGGRQGGYVPPHMRGAGEPMHAGRGRGRPSSSALASHPAA